MLTMENGGDEQVFHPFKTAAQFPYFLRPFGSHEFQEGEPNIH